MPQTQNLTAPTDCLSRAACHDAAAQLLDEWGEEWAAVAYFYASYHRVRAAILVDPVFDSLVDLPKVDPRISVQHRETSRHEGIRVPSQSVLSRPVDQLSPEAKNAPEVEKDKSSKRRRSSAVAAAAEPEVGEKRILLKEPCTIK